MSLKKFLKKLFAGIGKFFAGLLPEVKKAVGIAVEVVNAIKEYDATHGAEIDVLTNLIKGDWDDKVKDAVRNNIVYVFEQLRLLQTGLENEDQNARILAGIKTIQSLSEKARILALNDASVLFADILADGKVDMGDLLVIQKWRYEHPEVEEVK